MASSSAILFVILCVSTTASASSADAFGPEQRLLEEEADDRDYYSDLAPEPDPTTAEAYTPPATPEEEKKGCGEALMTWRMTALRWLYWFSKFGTGGAI